MLSLRQLHDGKVWRVFDLHNVRNDVWVLVKQWITPMKTSVSPHAIRRYIERVCGFPIDLDDDRLALAALGLLGFDLPRIEAEIARIVGAAPLLGAITLTKGGFRFVFRGGCVVTIMDMSERAAWGKYKAKGGGKYDPYYEE